MDNHIPSAVVVRKCCRIPPVLIEEAITKPQHLSKCIQPGMENGKETNKKNKGGWHHTAKDRKHKSFWRDMFLVEVLEDWDAETLKNVVGVEETGQHLTKVAHHVAPLDGFGSGVVVSIYQCWCKQEVQVFGKSWTAR